MERLTFTSRLTRIRDEILKLTNTLDACRLPIPKLTARIMKS